MEQTVHRAGFFNRIEIFALEVFYQRNGRRGTVIHRVNNDRHLLQAGSLGGAPTPVAGKNFIPILLRQWPYGYRFDDAQLTDALLQFLEVLIINSERPRLVSSAAESVDTHLVDWLGVASIQLQQAALELMVAFADKIT